MVTVFNMATAMGEADKQVTRFAQRASCPAQSPNFRMQSESPPVMFRAQAGVEGALFEESFLANRGGTFSMRGSVGEAALSPFNPLKAGIEVETQQLADLGLPQNTTGFRPTLAETERAAFTVIVGPPGITPGGQPRVTIF